MWNEKIKVLLYGHSFVTEAKFGTPPKKAWGFQTDMN